MKATKSKQAKAEREKANKLLDVATAAAIGVIETAAAVAADGILSVAAAAAAGLVTTAAAVAKRLETGAEKK